MAQPGPVQLAQDEGFEGCGSQAGRQGSSTEYVTREWTSSLTDRANDQRLEQRGWPLSNYEAVRAGNVLAQQAQFTQALGGHEVSAVNDESR